MRNICMARRGSAVLTVSVCRDRLFNITKFRSGDIPIYADDRVGGNRGLYRNNIVSHKLLHNSRAQTVQVAAHNENMQ